MYNNFSKCLQCGCLPIDPCRLTTEWLFVGYPNDEACRVALKTVRLWLEEKDNAKHVRYGDLLCIY